MLVFSRFGPEKFLLRRQDEIFSVSGEVPRFPGVRRTVSRNKSLHRKPDASVMRFANATHTPAAGAGELGRDA
jgi:hypothetical protein